MSNKEKFTFAMVDYRVIEDTSLTAYDLSVFTVLSRFADTDTGECYPKQETIAKLVGCSVGSVNKSIKKLENKGYIQTKRNWKMKNYIVNYIKDKNLNQLESKLHEMKWSLTSHELTI